MTENAISSLAEGAQSAPEPVKIEEQAPSEVEDAPKDPVSAEAEPTTEPVPTEVTEATVPTAPETTAEDAENVDAALNKMLGLIGESIADADDNFKIMIYGDPGTVKTSFALTAPNNLIWNLERGLISGVDSPHGIAENVKPLKFLSFAQGEVLTRKLYERPDELDWVKVFTVDTISNLGRRSLAELTTQSHAEGRIRSQYKAETDENTENNERMDRLVTAIADLDRDLILIAHERTVEPKNKPSKTYPDFSESLANKLEAKMDIVGRMTWEQMDDKLVPVMTVKAVGIHCKTRVKLPDQIIDPTWPQLHAAWKTTMEKARNGSVA
jgi:hypothetical protein